MASAVTIESVSKEFKRYKERPKTLKERVILFRRDKGYEQFWALRDVSFEIESGSTFGLIGANGSGKSTLLKIMAGILNPTSGAVAVNGRLGALLELGAGFHPDLTGRENVYLNASILGFSKKQIDARFDEIVGFAELEDFIDNQVRHYSSGMFVRLGFAVAVHMEPEVLLVDEVLAVGDEAFQDKCLARIRRFQQEGRTIVVVTHAVDTVRQMCNRAALLDKGKLAALGPSADVVRAYRGQMDLVEIDPDADLKVLNYAEVMDVKLHDESGRETDLFETGSKLIAEVDVDVKVDLSAPVVDINLYDNSSAHLFGTNTQWRFLHMDLKPGRARVRIELENLPLRTGRYFLIVGIHSRVGDGKIYGRSGRIHFLVETQTPEVGNTWMPTRFSIEGSGVKATRTSS